MLMLADNVVVISGDAVSGWAYNAGAKREVMEGDVVFWNTLLEVLLIPAQSSEVHPKILYPLT